MIGIQADNVDSESNCTYKQAKDTNSTLFVTYSWPLASLKIEVPIAPFHLIQSKPISAIKPFVTRNLPQNRKQKWRHYQNRKLSCLRRKFAKQKKSRRSIVNEFFIVHDQLCEILGQVSYELFDWSEITSAKVTQLVIFNR